MGQQFRKSILSSLPLTATFLWLVSCAVPQPAASQALRANSGPYELEVLVGGVAARTYLHAGETHLLGHAGERYLLRVHNRSARRVEAVVSVDGLDVIDGKPGDYMRKRGYLVPAYGSVDIEGWRVSEREVAAFRFGVIEDSYAARTGKPRNIGVIGVAIFPERRVNPPKPYVIRPELPRRDDYRDEELAGVESKLEAEAQPPAAAPSGRSADAARPSAESSGSGAAASAPAKRSRSGLGTEYGEALHSQIHEVPFKRADSSSPAALLGARYNDRAGLLALGIDLDDEYSDEDLARRQSARPFPVAERRFARPPAGWRRDF